MRSGSRSLEPARGEQRPERPDAERAHAHEQRDEAMNAPNAYMPPRAVRYQLTCGAALSAIVAIVP